MGDLIGYARISTRTQDPGMQHDALDRCGCIKTFTDRASGALDHRPRLGDCLDFLREGDTLVVWKLDRLGRSLRHLVDTVAALAERGVGFRSLTEGIDTTTAGGTFVFHVFCALAEFERALISERTREGLEAARARGRKGGRPTVMTPEKLAVARQMYDSKQYTVGKIARTIGVGRSTVYDHLREKSA